MSVADEVVKLLVKVPATDGPPSTEAQRHEANIRAKRADGSQGQAALELYLEALDIDPACRNAYEGIGRFVLSRASSELPAVEAALRFVDVGVARHPRDSALADVQKRLRDLLPRKAAPLTASSASRQRPRPSGRQEKPTRNCEYCGSPIPASSDACTSCQMSGEIEPPKPPQEPGLLERIVTRFFFKKD